MVERRLAMLRVVAMASLAGCLAAQVAMADPVFREADLADNPGRTPSGLAIGDFTGDGVLDAVTANSSSGTVTVFVQTAGLLFAMIDVTVGNVPMGVVTGDFNKDGKLDLVVSNGSDASVTFVKGLADGM